MLEQQTQSLNRDPVNIPLKNSAIGCLPRAERKRFARQKEMGSVYYADGCACNTFRKGILTECAALHPLSCVSCNYSRAKRLIPFAPSYQRPVIEPEFAPLSLSRDGACTPVSRGPERNKIQKKNRWTLQDKKKFSQSVSARCTSVTLKYSRAAPPSATSESNRKIANIR